MNNTDKKIGYLKGLMENAGLEKDSVSAKLLSGIVDLLGDLADRIDVVDDLLDDLNDYVESIDDDLSAMEDAESDDDFQFFDDEDDDEDFDDVDDGEDQLHLLRGESEEFRVPAICPDCGRPFLIRYGETDPMIYTCPHCGKDVSPETFDVESLLNGIPKE